MMDLPVLVIDDEPAVVAFVRAALERSGYAVFAVSSGAEALDSLKKRNFRGVISDMRTPGGITGADVHTWLAANRPELAARVVFITGDIVNEETRRLLGATGAPCLEKPFRVQQLLSAVQETFGSGCASEQPGTSHPAEGPAAKRAGNRPERSSEHEPSAVSRPVRPL